MNRRRVVLVFAALGALGAWLLVASRAGSTAGEHAEALTAATLAPSAPTGPEPKLEPGAAVPVAPAAPVAEDQPAAVGGEERADPNRPFAVKGEGPEERAERAREREELDRRWKQEQADGAWANVSGERITQLLAKEALPSHALRAVDCRQSICRFELRSSTGTEKEVMALIHAARELELETWVHPQQQPDGTWGMEVFFPKQGYRLSGGGGRIDEMKQVTDSPDLHVPPSTEEG